MAQMHYNLWIFSLLAAYLLLVYLKPYLRFINTQQVEEGDTIENATP